MHHIIMLFLIILIIAAIGVGVADKLKQAAPIVLVIMGLIIGLTSKVTDIELLDELLNLATNDEVFYTIVVSIFLAILLGDAVLKTTYDELKKSMKPISALAIAGTLLSFVLIALGTYYILDMGLVFSFVFAALMSPTDPISVLTLLKSMNVNKKIAVVIEGESLFNDGVAVVLFKLSAFSLATLISLGTKGIGVGLFEMVKVVGGGLIIAFALGIFFAWLTSKFNNGPFETILLLIMFSGGFFVAETLHVSGVIAIVVSGLVFGHFSKKRESLSESTQLAVHNTFDTLVLMSNSLIFLLVGLEVAKIEFTDRWGIIAIAILIVLVMRSIAVYSSLAFVKNFPTVWKHLINWAGVKGSLSIALALSLPHNFEGREDLLVLTFSVVIFSLVVQGMTIKPLVTLLGINKDEEILDDYEDVIIKMANAETAIKKIQQLYGKGQLQKSIYLQLKTEQEKLIEQLVKEEAELLNKYPELKEKQINDAMQIIRKSQLITIKELLNEHIIDDHTANKHSQKLIKEIVKNSNHH